MAGILNYWTLAMWEEFTPEDVQDEFKDSTKFKITRQEGLGWYTTVSRAPKLDPMLVSGHARCSSTSTGITSSTRSITSTLPHNSDFRKPLILQAIRQLVSSNGNYPEAINALHDLITRFRQFRLLKAIDALCISISRFEQPGLLVHIGALRNLITHFQQPGPLNGIDALRTRFKPPRPLNNINVLRDSITRILNDIDTLCDLIIRFKELGCLEVIGPLRDSISHFQAIGISGSYGFALLRSISNCYLFLLKYYEDGWNAYSGPEEYGDERLAFVAALIKHLKQGDEGRRSILLTSTPGKSFIRAIHNRIFQGLHKARDSALDGYPRQMLTREWWEATSQVTFISSSDNTLRRAQESFGIRYSIDTIPPPTAVV
ncbi:hypothetical protein Moror_3612 [Moniliophthora roreri MCA 2997]|uniref:Uncharacterized protein n=2 Tax=Moniliophthora roreri TaxID=221103 RepID=V2WE79_MONRO|nr:hypothetical protein Moror_3612 [Moniliophthora roreri MCA 2997]